MTAMGSPASRIQMEQVYGRSLTRVPVRADLLAVVVQPVRAAAGRRFLVVDEPPEVVGGILRRVIRRTDGILWPGDRLPQRDRALLEHVVAVVPVGERDVERMPHDHDVGHRVVPRQAGTPSSAV
jgi:hypothetical protein